MRFEYIFRILFKQELRKKLEAKVRRDELHGSRPRILRYIPAVMRPQIVAVFLRLPGGTE
jgi:hypothetical protein